MDIYGCSRITQLQSFPPCQLPHTCEDFPMMDVESIGVRKPIKVDEFDRVSPELQSALDVSSRPYKFVP